MTDYEEVVRLRILNIALSAKLRDAENEIGPPGHWICPTCGFVLMKMMLRPSDMAVGIDARDVQDICPNDGSSMRRKTWKEDALDSDRVGREQMKRADELESKLQEVQAERDDALRAHEVLQQRNREQFETIGKYQEHFAASRGEVVKPQERQTAYDNVAGVLYVSWEATDHAESISPNVLLRLTADDRVGGITVLDHQGRGEVVKAEYPPALSDAMNEGRWQDATYLLIAKVDSLYRERGEAVKVCPACHSHDVSLGLFGLSSRYVCSGCGADFAEPALWRRVG